jgi:alkylhydroperoxidase/carboxymuconolactone decarboxylase family protein YurZ
MVKKDIWTVFSDECPEVASAYLNLFEAIKTTGDLDDKTLALVLVGINSTTRDPLSTRFWSKRALAAGASKKEVEAASMLAWCQGLSSAEMSIPLILELE